MISYVHVLWHLPLSSASSDVELLSSFSTSLELSDNQGRNTLPFVERSAWLPWQCLIGSGDVVVGENDTGEDSGEHAVAYVARDAPGDVINGEAGDVTRCGIVKLIAASISVN